jgi:hypothetical protein
MALAAKIADIPDVRDEVVFPDNVSFYADTFPTAISLARAVYEMSPGRILVAWVSTNVNTAEPMNAWAHTFSIYVKAAKDRPVLPLVNGIVDGTPARNAGLKLRHSPVLAGTLPPEIRAIERITDADAVDYFEVKIEIEETGD